MKIGNGNFQSAASRRNVRVVSVAVVSTCLAACATKLPEPIACNVEPYLVRVDRANLPHTDEATFESATTESAGVDPLQSPFEEAIGAALRRAATQTELETPGPAPDRPPVVPQTLALSGGGPWGAYGAGFLNRWREENSDAAGDSSRAGDIPRFAVVTGVSTGALQSTFAFLGGDRLASLERIYREANNDRIFKKRNLVSALLRKNALNSLDPLRETIAEEIVAPGLIDAVAAEGNDGRLLLVGVVDLNSGELYAANMTKVAQDPGLSETARAACYADLLVASSAVPVEFDPVHAVSPALKQRVLVDGGVRAAAFVDSMNRAGAFAQSAAGRPVQATVVVNGMLDVCAKDKASPGILGVAGRSVGMLINQNNRDSVALIVNGRAGENQCARYTAVDFEEDFCGANTSTTDFEAPFLNRLADQAREKWDRGEAFASVGDCVAQ